MDEAERVIGVGAVATVCDREEQAQQQNGLVLKNRFVGGDDVQNLRRFVVGETPEVGQFEI